MSDIHLIHPSNRRNGYLARIAVEADHLVAVGGTSNDVTVLASTNASTWHRRPEPGRGLRDLVRVGDSWVVVGEYGYIARSADLAEWERIPHSAPGCLFAAAVDGSRVWIVGDNGQLLSLDGDALTAHDSGTDQRLSAVKVIDGALWLLGFDGVLRRRSASGTEVVLEGPRGLTDLVRTPTGTLVLTGDGGQVYRSENGGASFSPVDAGSHDDLEAVAALADGRVLVVGGGSTIRVSADDGRTFQPVAAAVEGHPGLWSIEPFGDGALIGGDDGMVLWFGDLDALPWTDREDTLRVEPPLDAVFAEGPEGFLGERLQAYLDHVDPPTPEEEAPEAPSDEEDEGDEEEDESEEEDSEEEDHENEGEDAWKPAAWAIARTLWTGSTADFEAVWGTPPPPELVELETRTARANPWSTFTELRLDTALMAEPPEGENLFEKVVLFDQINYLGTALGEAFGGLASIGTLGNGDGYHIEIYDHDGEKAVMFWNHDNRAPEYGFADHLQSLVYLCALCRAADEGWVSEEAATAGYHALRGHVTPSWHFSMDERDPDFEIWGDPDQPRSCEYFFWRAVWIVDLLRADGFGGVADIADRFMANINDALDDAMVESRLEASVQYVPTVLYTMWRAYLFDEPWLDRALEVGRAHSARLARDAALLIDDLRAGRRNSLGRIDDWSDRLARFRALDLNPARAADREAEAEARAQRIAAERDALSARMEALEGEALEALAWEELRNPYARPGLVERLRALAGDAPVWRGLDYLLEQRYSRMNQLYRDEEREACEWVARHADGALQAAVVGAALYPPPDDAPPALSHAWDILKALARFGRLDQRALPVLREKLAAVDLSEGPNWSVRPLLEVLGTTRDAASAAVIAGMLEGIPSEGGFETSLTWDDFVGEVADALHRIGDPDHLAVLVPFAASRSLRMRDARTGAVRALAAHAPTHATVEMLENLVDMTTQINSSEENSAALLAVARMAPQLSAEERARVAERLDPEKIHATSYVEVALALALARRAVGAEHDDVMDLLHRCLKEPGWKPEHTVRRLRFALEASDVAGMPPTHPELHALLHHPDASLRTDAGAKLGAHTSEGPRAITWFEAEDLQNTVLVAALADPELHGRQHLARQLGIRGPEVGRAALEAAALEVAERAPEHAGVDLDPADDALLREIVRALRDFPSAPSTLAVFDTLLRHVNRDVKDPVLRNPPDAPELRDAMERVAAEKWGWQERTAREWLDALD